MLRDIVTVKQVFHETFLRMSAPLVVENFQNILKTLVLSELASLKSYRITLIDLNRHLIDLLIESILSNLNVYIKVTTSKNLKTQPKS